MPTLASDLRKQLENVCIQARDLAEDAARSALQKRAVDAAEPFAHFSSAEKHLRNRLRARGRQAGDVRDEKKTQSIDRLTAELAYEYWHRMLFARFLAENQLLMHPSGVAVSLEECEELARIEPRMEHRSNTDKTNSNSDPCSIRVPSVAKNGFELAAQFASGMLPQIFRTDDVLMEVEFAPEHRIALEKLLAKLPQAAFTASDSLGWVYQFWQSKRKDEVNRSEVKIGANEISAVTQLFTEPYMVEFLLHNTLGAWWWGKVVGSQLSVDSEEKARRAAALPGVNWEYLRFVRTELSVDGSKTVDGCQLSVVGKGCVSSPTTDNRQPTTSPDNRQLTTDNSSWRPAAGTFDGWPKAAKDIKILDPCCGSGHFLVAALHHLVPIRMAEEGLSAAVAVDAVLRDNLHGLEIDERCCQIAAFALALAAWKFPDLECGDLSPLLDTLECGDLSPLLDRVPMAHSVPPTTPGKNPKAVTSHRTPHRLPLAWEGKGGAAQPLGYRALPPLHIACSGIGPQCSAEEWVELAEQSGIPMPRGGREPVKNGLLNLHRLFSQAPTLGSLIDPTELPSDLIAADFETIQPYLAAIMKAEKSDDETRERAIAAAGMVKAAELLAGEYTLVVTNVPYLVMKRMGGVLRAFCAQSYGVAKMDLATVFLARFREALAAAGTLAFVMPQNWLFLGSYELLRRMLLRECEWELLARLGPGAFETISGEVVKAVLTVIANVQPSSSSAFAAIDVAELRGPLQKAKSLETHSCMPLVQAAQLRNPDARITFVESTGGALLSDAAISMRGIVSGDGDRWMRTFWEINSIALPWRFLQSTVDQPIFYGGREQIIDWSTCGQGMLRPGTDNLAYGTRGLALGQIGDLPCTLYTGELYDNNTGVIVPKDSTQLAALWAFCSSPEYAVLVRRIDQVLKVTNATLVKVPFDLARWQQIAAEKYPDGLPEPESDDPTQWLFHGRPEESTAPLQAAAARLLGYRWPAELDDSGRVGPARLSERRPTTAPDADGDGVADGGPARPESRWSHPTSPMRLSARARALVERCDELLPLADADGMVCISSVRGEPPAAERLLEVLRAAYSSAPTGRDSIAQGAALGILPLSSHSPERATPGAATVEPPGPSTTTAGDRSAPSGLSDSLAAGNPGLRPGLSNDTPSGLIQTASAMTGGDAAPSGARSAAGGWSGAMLDQLLTAADAKAGTSLDDWLRNAFFEQHCKLFHHRPFIWHIWDGRKDGFSCLVNYHKLDHVRLESLTYSYLGDWIKAQAGEAKGGRLGADLRLAAAQALQEKLKLILTGEPPYDIFVRWKPLAEQAIGWHPDLNDGVRMNIRPFVAAGVLRKNPNIKWTKDRGKEPQRDKADYPWFWNGNKFVGERVNDVHLTNDEKQAARKKT